MAEENNTINNLKNQVNSNKKMSVNIEKFTGLMVSAEKQLKKQTSLLGKLVNIQEQLITSNIEKREDDARQQAREKVTEEKVKEKNSTLDRLKSPLQNLKDGFSLKKLGIAGLLFAFAPQIIDFAKGFFGELLDGFGENLKNMNFASFWDFLSSPSVLIGGGFLLLGRRFLIGSALMYAVLNGLENYLENKGIDIDIANPEMAAALSAAAMLLGPWLVKSIAKNLVLAPLVWGGAALWNRVTGKINENIAAERKAAAEAAEKAYRAELTKKVAEREAAERAAEKAAADLGRRKAELKALADLEDAADNAAVKAAEERVARAKAELAAKRLAEEKARKAVRDAKAAMNAADRAGAGTGKGPSVATDIPGMKPVSQYLDYDAVERAGYGTFTRSDGRPGFRNTKTGRITSLNDVMDAIANIDTTPADRPIKFAKKLPFDISKSMGTLKGAGRRGLSALLGLPGLAGEFILSPTQLGTDLQEDIQPTLEDIMKNMKAGIPGKMKEMKDFIDSLPPWALEMAGGGFNVGDGTIIPFKEFSQMSDRVAKLTAEMSPSVTNAEDRYFERQRSMFPIDSRPSERALQEMIKKNEENKRLSLLQTPFAGFQPESAGSVALVAAAEVSAEALTKAAVQVAQAASRIRGGGGAGMGYALGARLYDPTGTLRSGPMPNRF